MEIKIQEHKTKEKTIVILYHLSLSADETYEWAHRPNNVWPCSQLSGHRLWVAVDQSGLHDMTIDGKYGVDIDSDELCACVADHLPDDCKNLWPCWNG